MDLLPLKVEELVHELSVLPFNDMHGTVTSPATLTNYSFWGLVALVTAVLLFTVAARRVSLVPSGRFTGAMEAGVEFIRDMAVDVIGPKDGPKYTAFLATFFFMILVSNMFGLIPGGKSFAGSIGGTTALALISWLVFVWVGFKKNGFFGYFKSLIPSGVREMPLAGRLVVLERTSSCSSSSQRSSSARSRWQYDSLPTCMPVTSSSACSRRSWRCSSRSSRRSSPGPPVVSVSAWSPCCS